MIQEIFIKPVCSFRMNVHVIVCNPSETRTKVIYKLTNAKGVPSEFLHSVMSPVNSLRGQGSGVHTLMEPVSGVRGYIP
jgi:hypothetical protein